MSNVDMQTVANLRQHFPEETRGISDEQLLADYRAFSVSQDWGNNDELFPGWIGTSL